MSGGVWLWIFVGSSSYYLWCSAAADYFFLYIEASNSSFLFSNSSTSSFLWSTSTSTAYSNPIPIFSGTSPRLLLLTLITCYDGVKTGDLLVTNLSCEWIGTCLSWDCCLANFDYKKAWKSSSRRSGVWYCLEFYEVPNSDFIFYSINKLNSISCSLIYYFYAS